MNLKHSVRSDNYLVTGLIAAILIIALSLALSAPFSPDTFGSWVAFIWIAAVPALLVIGLQWHYDQPSFVRTMSQPGKGAAFLGITLVAMICSGAFLYFVPGHGAGPRPMLINATIMSVVGAFWVIVAWRSWPLSILFKHPVALGVAAWVSSYMVAYVAFELFFNFEFAKGAPFYSPDLDPHGFFNAWSALVFSVTTTAIIIVLAKMFDFWPLPNIPGSNRAFLRGLYTSIYVLTLSAFLMWLFLGPLGFEIVDFMVRVPIAVIFGAFLVTNIVQFRLFAGTPQPAKGVSLLMLGIVLGLLMEEFYRAIGPLLVGRPLPPGPPHYQIELWVATALLGVTFPLIVVVTGYFDLWPIKRTRTTVAATEIGR